MALAVRRGAGDDLHRSGREAAHRHRLPAAAPELERAEDAGGREAAHLDVGGEADTELLRVAPLPPGGLLGSRALVVEELEPLVERRLVVARVDLEPRGDRGRELPDEVHPADLDRILADRGRQLVHRPLDRVRGLGAAGAAVRVGRGRVREHAGAVEVVCDGVVAPGVEPGAEQRDPGRDGLEVGAHRGRELHPDARDLPALVRGELDLLDEVAAVDRGEAGFGALLDPLHRAAEPPGAGDDEHVLGVHVHLRAEAAADVRRDHPGLGLGDPEHERVGGAHDVRRLRRRDDRDVACRRRDLAHDAARLHRGPGSASAGGTGPSPYGPPRRRPCRARRPAATTCNSGSRGRRRGRAGRRRRGPSRRR